MTTPTPPRRVSVVGSSGSGKTTFARRLGAVLDAAVVELDAIHHQRDWTPLPPDEFRSAVDHATPVDGRWVVDGNYAVVRDVVWPRADTVVFLDLSRWQVMWQLVPRTLRRLVTREELWNGNREPWSNVTSLDPERNVVVWSWTHHRQRRDEYEAATADHQWSHLTFVRLPDRDAAAAYLASLA